MPAACSRSRAGRGWAHRVVAVTLGTALLASSRPCHGADPDPLEPVLEFARSQGDREVRDAIRLLALLAPTVLLGLNHTLVTWALGDPAPAAGSGARAAPVAGGQDARSRSARKLLDLLRLEKVHRDPRVAAAWKKLAALPEAEKKKLDAAREKARGPWLEAHAGAERLKAMAQRNALHLETSLDAVATMHQSRAANCRLNLQILAGAVEMYNLDKNVSVTALDARLVAELQKGKYLPSEPEDPGYGPGSWRHYLLLPGDGIACTHHGFPEPPEAASAETTVRQQAEMKGIRDPALLSRFADVPLVPLRLPGGADVLR